MRTLACFFFLIIGLGWGSTQAQPRQLHNFDQLMEALNTGYQVRVVIFYQKCTLIVNNEIADTAPNVTGGMNVDVYEYFAPRSIGNEKAYVVFSENKFIQRPRNTGYVYNYGKVRIDADNKVKITVNYIDILTHEVYMDQNFFGLVNDGFNEGGIYLFASQ